MTSDQDAKVVAEPQTQRVQEGKDSAHLVGAVEWGGGESIAILIKDSLLGLVRGSQQEHWHILGSAYGY